MYKCDIYVYVCIIYIYTHTQTLYMYIHHIYVLIYSFSKYTHILPFLSCPLVLILDKYWFSVA